MRSLPVEVTIAVQILKRYAEGDTIEARFRAVLPHLDEGCFMVGGGPNRDDLRFRSAVGAVMLSYPNGSVEQERIAEEMRRLNQFSAFIQAAQVGLTASFPEADESIKPLGLLGIYRDHELAHP